MIILVMVLEGIHRGFLRSAMNLGAFFLSIITSYLFYPVVSAAVKDNESLFSYLIYYTEGAEKISSFESSQLLVNNLSSAQLNDILTHSNISEPFTSLIRQNVEAKAFASSGLSTIGQYYNMTIVSAALNIISFLAVFLIARVIFAFVLGAIDYTVEFPELRQYDRTSGALFGALRGAMFCFLIMMVVPIIMLVLPVDQITEYFRSSDLAIFFSDNNFLLHLIRGAV
jgi:uncharacterized membrane protein required for colicin V production